MKFISKDIKLVNVSDTMARKVLCVLAKKFNAKFRTSIVYNGSGTHAAFTAYIGGNLLCSTKRNAILISDYEYYFFPIDDLPFFKCRKHKLILTGIVKTLSNYNLVFGPTADPVVVTSRGTTLEQLLVEADLAA